MFQMALVWIVEYSKLQAMVVVKRNWSFGERHQTSFLTGMYRLKSPTVSGSLVAALTRNRYNTGCKAVRRALGLDKENCS